MTVVLIKGKFGNSHAHKGIHHVKIKTEIGVILLQAKIGSRLLANHQNLREKPGTVFLFVLRRNPPC